MKKIKNKAKIKKTASDDGAALWKAVTETVKPLQNRDLPVEDAASPPPSAKSVKRQGPRLPPVPTPKTPLPELRHGQQPGLDKSTAKRLRRGKVQIAARLDLHGLTQNEARPILEDFIERAWASNKREVLIITGKGTRADGSIGILREAVPRWLNISVNRNRITAFTHAAPKDGGEGALYVRLKRRS